MGEYLKSFRPTTGDPFYDLVAAVYKLAVDDARRGVVNAAAWLDYSFPEWRRYADPPRPKRPRPYKPRPRELKQPIG